MTTGGRLRPVPLHARIAQARVPGTFIDVATASNNIHDGEQIPKGHTRIIQVGRKMYMASQGLP